jgi:hypothetical protein
VQRDANVTVKLNGQPLFFPRASDPHSRRGSSSSSSSGATAEAGGAAGSACDSAGADGAAGGADGGAELNFAGEVLPSKGQLDAVQVLWVHETCAQICPLVLPLGTPLPKPFLVRCFSFRFGSF